MDCRADPRAGDPFSRAEPWLPLVAFALFVAGFVVTRVYVQQLSASDSFDGIVTYDVWVVLVAGLAGFALSSALLFAVRLARLVVLARPLRARLVLGWTLLTLLVLATPLAALFTATDMADANLDTSLAHGTRPVTVVAGLCELPGLVALVAVRHIASADGLWTEPAGCRLRLLLRLRAELRTLLGLLGAFLTLLVVTVGMRRRAFVALDPDLAIPVEAVLLYGLVFAVLLGLFYALASGAVDARGHRLLDEFAPMPDPVSDSATDALARRTAWSAVLGHGGSWASFQTTVVIAAPLLTALVGSAIGD